MHFKFLGSSAVVEIKKLTDLNVTIFQVEHIVQNWRQRTFFEFNELQSKKRELCLRLAASQLNMRG